MIEQQRKIRLSADWQGNLWVGTVSKLHAEVVQLAIEVSRASTQPKEQIRLLDEAREDLRFAIYELCESVKASRTHYADPFEKRLVVAARSTPDTERLDWLQTVMTHRDFYVEVYLAGLRNGPTDASAYQIESQPQTAGYGFPTIQRPTLREAIDAARQCVHLDAARVATPDTET